MLDAAGGGVTPGRLAVLLTAVAFATAGQLVLKHGMVAAQNTSRESGHSLVLVAASSPWIIGGLLIFAASGVLWLMTLAHVPLSVAYPVNALGYIAILATSSLLLHERTNPWMWLGTVLVGAGLVLVVVMAPAPSDSPARLPRPPEKAVKVSADDAQTALEPGSTQLALRRAR
jgi:drug/metabolite transporter (DMT)-like permease